MTINLTKGAKINLSKEAPGMKRVRVCLGWSPNDTDTGKEYDLDASIFVCKHNVAVHDGVEKKTPMLINDAHLVYYGNKAAPGVVHSGDNLTGEGEGDDEVITVEFDKLSAEASELSIVVTIHDYAARKQNFGQIPSSYVRLVDADSNVEIAKYSLEDEFSGETAVQFGSLVKKDDGWTFSAVGKGFNRGLGDFVSAYGSKAA